MKRQLVYSGLLCGALLVTACTNTVNMGSGLVQSVSQSTAQLLGDLVVLNKNEMNAAQLGRTKAKNPAVRRYANYIYYEHKKNLQQTMSLSRVLRMPFDIATPLATNLAASGEAVVNTLNPLDGAAFDKAFMNAMVEDHQKAILLLDGMMKETTDPKMSRHLAATKKHIMIHLKKAQAIQQKL